VLIVNENGADVSTSETKQEEEEEEEEISSWANAVNASWANAVNALSLSLSLSRSPF